MKNKLSETDILIVQECFPLLVQVKAMLGSVNKEILNEAMNLLQEAEYELQEQINCSNSTLELELLSQKDLEDNAIDWHTKLQILEKRAIVKINGITNDNNNLGCLWDMKPYLLNPNCPYKKSVVNKCITVLDNWYNKRRQVLDYHRREIGEISYRNLINFKYS